MLRPSLSAEDWQDAAELAIAAAVADSFAAFTHATLRPLARLLGADFTRLELRDCDRRLLAHATWPPRGEAGEPSPANEARPLPDMVFSGRRHAHEVWTLRAYRVRSAFGAREHELANFLRPRLAPLSFGAAAPSMLARLVETGLRHESVAYVRFDPGLRVAEISSAARQLLAHRLRDTPIESALTGMIGEAAQQAKRRAGPRAAFDAAQHPGFGRGLIFWLPAGPLYLLQAGEDDPTPSLTRRERDILAWLREGKSNASIGAILGISARTVERHCGNIYAKLGVKTRLEAVAALPEAFDS